MIIITVGCHVSLSFTSEYRLLGHVCSYITLSKSYSNLPEFDFSTTTPLVVLPANLISVKESMVILKELYDNLQIKSKNCVRVGVLSRNSPALSFYIPEEHKADFITGYYTMPHMIEAYYSQVEDQQIRNYFPPSKSYVSQCKLVGTPTVSDDEGFKFVLNVPNYAWTLPRDDDFVEQKVANLVTLFLRDCTGSEHQIFNDKQHYLRIMLYQDSAVGMPYARIYLRDIDTCTYPSHKEHLKACPIGTLPIEINYATRGHFFRVVQSEWNDKDVYTILEY